MTKLVPFPSVTVETITVDSDTSVSIPTPLPPVVLHLDGAEYEIPADHLAKYLRFTADQLQAVDAMRAAGVAEETISQAFPRQPRLIPDVAGTVENPQTEAALLSPAPAPVGDPRKSPEMLEQERRWRKCPIGHNKTAMNEDTGDVECTRCGFAVLRGTGFRDNRNPGWTGMSSRGAARYVDRFAVNARGDVLGSQLHRGDGANVG